MPGQFNTSDGRYLLVEQDDGNAVVYDRDHPVWDRWSYEAANTPRQPAPPPQNVPEPSTPGRIIRVTDESDGDILNRGYAYWSQCWVGPDATYAFAGHADGQPRFYKVHLRTGRVERLGPLLPYNATAEGWYWDANGWIYLTHGSQLRRCHPFTGEDTLVFDIAPMHPGCRLWQAHSSDDGQTHCATVQQITDDGPYKNLGTVALWNGVQHYFPALGKLDESQITSDGVFLVIKEDNDNRIINLETRETRMLKDADGAVGHSDCGDGILVGEDDQHGACVLWDLRQPLTPERRRQLFQTWNLGHVSIRAGRCLLSGSAFLSLVSLDGYGVTTVAPHGMVSDGTYDTQVHGNLDPSGQVAAYVSNVAGRMDLYLLEL